MTNNEYSIIDSFGDSSDWIELYNPNDYDILLEGYGLSDDESDRLKWIFPKGVTIKAKDYLLIFASGNDIVVESNYELHTNFALGNDDTRLVLCQPNFAIVDSADIMSMPGNVSRGRLDSGEYGYFTLPTPHAENIGSYVDSVDINSNIILQDVYINEVSSSQIRLTRNVPDYLTEYIEIYNKSDETINLEGYSITDSSQSPWIFPRVNIDSRGYLVLLLKGAPDRFIPSIDADLSISASGEELIFKNSDGIIIDYFKTGYLTGEYSSGRKSSTGSQRYFFILKTPGKENPDSTIKLYSQKPTFSHAGGMVDEVSFFLDIGAAADSVVRYTLDGSMPSDNSKIYYEHILISQDTIVRAAVFEENKLPSAATSATYIFSREHTLSIVCLSTNPDNLFNEGIGIYAEGPGFDNSEFPHYSANFWLDWERPICFEFYETNGELAIWFDAGIQISGQTSRAQEQKSLIIRIRDEYGLNEIYYPFFDDREVQEFKHILLRTSGQDSTHTKIKDYYFHQSIKKYSDLDIMDGRPTAVYINAQYWGIYNIREKINEDYFESHYGVDTDNITIIEGTGMVNAGNNSDWLGLRNFCTNNDFDDDLLYEQLENRVDVDAFIDYVIVQAFFCNYDYANVKYWRENSEGGKWRPILYDLDASVNSYNYTIDRLNIYFKEGNFSNIFYALKQNDKFCEEFIARYAYFLNEVFTEENISNDIDGIIGEISLEMKYHIERWGAPYNVDIWMESVLTLKKNIIDRRPYMVEHLANRFDIDSAKINELFPWYGN